MENNEAAVLAVGISAFAFQVTLVIVILYSCGRVSELSIWSH